jgi:hypothetical protein
VYLSRSVGLQGSFFKFTAALADGFYISDRPVAVSRTTKIPPSAPDVTDCPISIIGAKPPAEFKNLSLLISNYYSMVLF